MGHLNMVILPLLIFLLTLPWLGLMLYWIIWHFIPKSSDTTLTNPTTGINSQISRMK